MTISSLADLSSKRYRIALEESWQHELPEVRNPDKRWYEQIPTRCGGHIMLYAEDPEVILEFYTATARPTCIESLFCFPAHLLPLVAKQVGARRRRKLPEKSKEAFARGREKGMAIH